MKEIIELVDISKYAGERFDLVQAAGGNTSVKLDNGEMLIKASGYTLSEVEPNSGYSRVITNEVSSIVNNEQILQTQEKRKREKLTSTLMKAATLDKNNRPSIETLLHSLLLKYTLHTHPLVVNMIVSQKNHEYILKTIFKSVDIAIVSYETPGVELALGLHNEIKTFKATPNIIFLQNHGLIITTDKKEDIKRINETVLQKIEAFLGINMQHYKLTNKITELLKSIDENFNITYKSEDSSLNNSLKNNRVLFSLKPFCPDTLVYCGFGILELENLENIEPIIAYKKQYYELPKVIICEGNIFIIAPTIKKAKEIEEVLKFHILVLENNHNEELNFLDMDELAYLSNWEAEKYRQNL